MNKPRPPARSSGTEIAEFLRQVKQTPLAESGQGRLLFALDATASRQPAWDRACQLQGEMFLEAAGLGGLNIQLLWYRGFAEFEAGPWVSKGEDLLLQMRQVYCVGGTTQIARVLQHALAESRLHRINALVFVGDCMEESPQSLYRLAGQLGLLGVPIFIFHEGRDHSAAQVFQKLASLSQGAYCPFDATSARQLRDLLSAVAVFAAGGRSALEDFARRRGGLALQLTHALERR